jgi:hypothetical protein
MMMTSTTFGPDRARSGKHRRASSSSPPGGGRTILDHALKQLREFLSALFRKDERIHFFPVLRQEFVTRYTDDDAFPERLHRHRLVHPKLDKKTGLVHRVPLRGPSPFSTTLASKQFDSVVRRLRDLNDLHYDIYTCANPLAFSKRCQKTVLGVRWLLLESDEMPKAEQYAFLDRHRRHVQVAVDSGRRSVQMLVPIRPIRNPHCLRSRFDLIWMLKEEEDTTVELPAFDEIASHVEELARNEGFIADTGPLHNFAGLVRCPGFAHPLTGNMATLVHLKERDGKIEQTEEVAADAGQWDQVAVEVEVAVESVPAVEEPSPQSSAGATMLSGGNPEKPTFLDDLETFERLKIEGIPARHQRIRLHHVLFTAARLWRWSAAQLQEHWRQIVSIHPANIGCSVEEAVADVRRHWQEAGQFQFRLPNTATLPPQLEAHEIELARQRLEAMGCTDSVSAARIVGLVCYPKIRECPQACQRGTVAIRSQQLQAVSVGKRYRPPLEWLKHNNLLVTTDRHYRPGQRSRLFFVNAPLVLWLLGFRTCDLVWKWDGASRHREMVVSSAECVDQGQDWMAGETVGALVDGK